MKPIIIDDIQTALKEQKADKQNDTDTKVPARYLHINQNYPQLVIRPPPRPPDPLRTTPKVNAEMGPNLDFEEIHLIKRE